ncbi:hypothetical protein MUK42_27599 [Musa troglodytarum]|uniref:Uncharacterized protein n=1 Tax=Musa troglodytarum TaxID=320322 RepID=A0A9E7JP66_9LILI|nr:hypothetical protein MUK42_27599 [Musa troglodytarum]
MPEVRLHQHQVLLLQQLQPLPAAPLLQELPSLLDQRRRPSERSHRRWHPQELQALQSLLLLLFCFQFQELQSP